MAGQVGIMEDRISLLTERLDRFERSTSDAGSHQFKDSDSRHGAYSRTLHEFDKRRTDQLGNLSDSERCMYLERLISDTADKNAQSLSAASARVDSLQSRVSACEASCAMQLGFKASHDNLAKEHSQLITKHMSLQEQVDSISRAVATGGTPVVSGRMHTTATRHAFQPRC